MEGVVSDVFTNHNTATDANEIVAFATGYRAGDVPRPQASSGRRSGVAAPAEEETERW